MTHGLSDRLILVRALAARWLPPPRRRDRKRISLGLVLSLVAGMGGDDPVVLAEAEIVWTCTELMRRGRRDDGTRVTNDDLRAAGLVLS